MPIQETAPEPEEIPPTSTSMVVPMVFERATKRTFFYRSKDFGAYVKSIYIDQMVYPYGPPKTITITIEP